MEMDKYQVLQVPSTINYIYCTIIIYNNNIRKRQVEKRETKMVEKKRK